MVLAIQQRVARVSAVVVYAGGTVLGTSEQNLGLRQLPGGRVEQSPRDLLAAVVHAGRAATAEAGVPVDVVALALDGDSVLAWIRSPAVPCRT